MKLSDMLKQKRIEHQMTQEDLAQKIFVTNKTISNWENEKATPDIDSLIRLAKLFDLSLDNLLMEGSDIVENIKKIEAAKVMRKFFWISWMTNIIFALILATQNMYGKLSHMAGLLIGIAIVLNLLVMNYFRQKAKHYNNNQSIYQTLSPGLKVLLIIVIVIIFVLLIIFFMS